MLTQVWVVEGHTGEYSDHTRWVVAAYTTEEQARLHAARAAEEAARIREEAAETPGGIWALDWHTLSAYDPLLQLGGGGTTYRVVAAHLCRHVDEYIEHGGQP